uniref:ATP-grasp domain-containing protein n=1 Tax=Candidatus Caldatribacterium saccharofermentans TaxID=1454753 RepID=A0A7V4THQ9_9BACT
MNKLRKRQVLVTAVGGGVGQAILKALRLSGLDTFLVGTDVHPFCAGFSFCDRAYLVPWAGEEEYTSRIFEICSREHIAYLFPGSDPELLPLARMKKDLLHRLGCQVIVSDESCVQVCRDKLRTYEFFRERNLPFAETALYDSLEALVERRGFPVIAKPLDGSGSSGVRVLFSREDLHALQDVKRYMFQEYLIPVQWGKERVTPEDVFASWELRQEHEISIQVLKGLRGETLGIFVSENVLKSGIPMRVEPRSIPEVEYVALKVAEAFCDLGLFGPLNIQGKITRRGFVAFEVNPRFTGITGVRTLLGFRECEAVIRYLEGEEPSTIQSSLRPDTTKIALRFVDECIISRESIETLGKRRELGV